MNPRSLNTRDEEAKIQAAIIKELRNLNWFVKETHGNMYQSGFPDLFCSHTRYGHRWLEVKKPVGYVFTPAQLETFPQLCAHGSNVWIATTHVDVEAVLMRPPNWFMFLQVASSHRGPRS